MIKDLLSSKLTRGVMLNKTIARSDLCSMATRLRVAVVAVGVVVGTPLLQGGGWTKPL